MSITRLLFAICGVSRGASALWSHTARARKLQDASGRKEESNRKREKSIIQKKRKNPSRKSARAKLRKESSKR
ncbi:unknown protein [Bathycoccus prasinos]|uniref:Uncharacterized protein n=1 Tax=Bathycoccus prasinos TaxID=41875 RepID=K8EG60_9CHLO|nr:unknown protein [Bathycoccus prasinos]CCO17137.1 unknown protein [Bathycoccus prasinos]|eukprot:XP_007512537.1 unknown protein [Bathycoccus prasinos]